MYDATRLVVEVSIVTIRMGSIRDWEIKENAHPAIITEEEVRAIIAVRKERRKEWTDTRGNQQSGDYLLSGNNFGGEPLFICLRHSGRMMQ